MEISLLSVELYLSVLKAVLQMHILSSSRVQNEKKNHAGNSVDILLSYHWR